MKYFSNPWAKVGLGLVVVLVLGLIVKAQFAPINNGVANVQVSDQVAAVGAVGDTPWTKVSIGSNGDTGNTSAVALGLDGFARIAYYNDTQPGSLQFVKCADINCSTKTTTVLDSKGTYYAEPSLAIGADGNARISYYDDVSHNLKFIQCTNDDCSNKVTNTVDSASNVGYTPSMALGADGNARISYYDNNTFDLKFAECTKPDCSSKKLTTVDSTGRVGNSPSLALGADGNARISYYDYDLHNLKFAECTNPDCSAKTITLVDSTGSVGADSSLALGADGNARIAYYRGTTPALEFIQCTNPACSDKTTTDIDSSGRLSPNVSLALGADGLARIAYDDETDNILKFAECANPDCSDKKISTVDSSGGYSALALGSDGLARIIYRNTVPNSNNSTNLGYAIKSGTNTNHVPVLGYSSADTLGTPVVATDGTGSVTIPFRISDGDLDNVTTFGWQYSANGGQTWTGLSAAYLTGKDGAKTSASDWSGPVYNLVWNSKGVLNNVTQSNIRFRFKVNDGKDDSAYASTGDFAINNSTGKPLPTCIAFSYSNWAPAVCSAGQTQTRTVTAKSPVGCVGGGNPLLTRSCPLPTPTCTSFTYTAWSPATCPASKIQYRGYTKSSPPGCVGGNPVFFQSCNSATPAKVTTCTGFTYSAWSPATCPANKTQTRSIVSKTPSGCVGGTPVFARSCTK